MSFTKANVNQSIYLLVGLSASLSVCDLKKMYKLYQVKSSDQFKSSDKINLADEANLTDNLVLSDDITKSADLIKWVKLAY